MINIYITLSKFILLRESNIFFVNLQKEREKNLFALITINYYICHSKFQEKKHY